MSVINLLPHHVANLAFNHFTSFRYFDEEHEEYGEFREVIKEIYKNLLENPSQMVRIVGGLDFICLQDGASCRLRNNCKSKLLFKDEECLREFGFRLGSFYSMGGLSEIFNDYKKISGYTDPTSKLLHEMSGIKPRI